MWSFPVAVALALTVGAVSCQSQTKAGTEPAPKPKPEAIELVGVDTSKLTLREKEEWSTYVGELLAPCPAQPVSIAQCVIEQRACPSCLQAAQFLLKQVTSGKARSQVEGAFRQRFATDAVKSLDVAGSPIKGLPDAAVTIVEWADFQCPFCAMASAVLDRVVARYPDHVKLVFKHYPLSIHEQAEPAARAAVAADKQGKFWEMHTLLFKNQKQLDERSIEQLAKELSLDLKQFNEDRKSEAVADKVSSDRKQADQLGLRGTPLIYINGRAFDLESFDLAEDLDDWIRLEIVQQTGKQVLPREPVAPAKLEPAAAP